MAWLEVILVIQIALLAYAYGIFPAVMALLAWRLPRRGDGQSRSPAVSLIIPAHNEQQVIREKLGNALATDYEDLEIILASDGSTDRTCEIAGEYQDRIQLLPFDRQRGKTAAMTDAISHSKGEVLCLCDANVMFEAKALKHLVNRLSDNRVGAVTADVRLQSEQSNFGLAESLYYKLERQIQLGESRLGSVIGVDGGMYVVRKELFPELPPDTVLDDFSVSMHVLNSGYDVVYEPNAVAFETSTELASSEFKRRIRIGEGTAQVLARGLWPGLRTPMRLWLFVSHKLLRWLSPLMFLFLVPLIGWL